VTPGSQQYWLQAFNNVMYGRWENIQAGYGKAVLGYFGKTPLPPDPAVVKKASEQLELEPFEGDPLEAAPNNIAEAQQILRDHNLEVNDENTFLVLACIVPGGKIETNQGLNFLLGKPKIDIPLKKKEEPKVEVAPAAAPAAGAAPIVTGPVTTSVKVQEGGQTRTFSVTVEPVGGTEAPAPVAEAAPPAAAGGTQVFSTFAGSVEVVDILVKEGDKVNEGDVVAAIEAMKAKHDIKAPCGGTVSAIHVSIGDEIDSTKPIVSIA
jgi:pyruvate carboxylase subunit B